MVTMLIKLSRLHVINSIEQGTLVAAMGIKRNKALLVYKK